MMIVSFMKITINKRMFSMNQMMIILMMKYKSKKDKVNTTGDDAREGLTAIVSVKVPDPKFSSQTKDKLVSSEIRNIVEHVISEKVSTWFDQNPSVTKTVIEKISQAAMARDVARKARDSVRRKGTFELSGLPGKLADCQIQKREGTELFIVEGDSALGTTKAARNSEFQAILPIRGKILNVQKASLSQMLEDKECGSIIQVIGAGSGKSFELDEARYGRIILMSDADVDGAHISTLIMSFFYSEYPKLIEDGHLYLAVPPLYKISKGPKVFYATDDKDKDRLINWIPCRISHFLFTFNTGTPFEGVFLTNSSSCIYYFELYCYDNLYGYSFD